MIEIRNLSFIYHGVQAPVLKNINMHIGQGEFILLTGASGSGKSTFLYCLNGIIPQVLNGLLIGEIKVLGLDPRNTPISQLAKTVGMVFQTPENQIFMPIVKEDVEFGCRNLGFSEEKIREMSSRAMSELKIDNLQDRHVNELSAGQKQRLAIAGIYAIGPDIFLFDEPLQNLDAKGREDFIAILLKLKQSGRSVIVAEHEYEYLQEIFDKRFVLENGEIIEYTVGNEVKTKKSFQYSVDFAGKPAVELKNISFGYGDNLLFDNLNLKIDQGDCIAITGDNGCGKTTLFKLMSRLVAPHSGEIRVKDKKINNLDEIVGTIAFLFQNPDEQLFATTVADEITGSAIDKGKHIDLKYYLELFNLTKYKDAHPYCLSKGERQKVALASILAIDPEILIMDEPTTGLDRKSWKGLMDTVMRLNAGGKTVIFSTHNQTLIKNYARRVVKLDQGRIVSDEISK